MTVPVRFSSPLLRSLRPVFVLMGFGLLLVVGAWPGLQWENVDFPDESPLLLVLLVLCLLLLPIAGGLVA